MKKRAFLSLMFTLLLTFCVVLHPLATDLPSPSDDFYVNDFANVLSEETEKHILDVNDQLQPETGAQIVVVAVDFLDGLNSEEYSYQLFNEWDIGSEDENNGVLLLISPGEEKYWITVGRGLETTLSSGILSQICNSIVEVHFDNGDYDKFVKIIFDGVAQHLADHYNVSLSGDSNVSPAPGYDDSYDEYYQDVYYEEELTIMDLIILFIILLIIVSILRSWLRAFGPTATYRKTYIPKTKIHHVPYRTPRNTIHRTPPPPPPSSFGGFGGFGGMGGLGRTTRRSSSPFGSRTSRRTSSSFGSSTRRSSSSFGGSTRRSSAPRSGGGGGSRGGGFGRK